MHAQTPLANVQTKFIPAECKNYGGALPFTKKHAGAGLRAKDIADDRIGIALISVIVESAERGNHILDELNICRDSIANM